VAVTVVEAPFARAPSAHGKPPAHGADAETKERFAGVGSPSCTAGASDGPLFVTSIENVTFGPPGTAVAGPVLTTARSALGASVSVSVAESSPGFGSVTPRGTETVAVFTSAPVADEATVATCVYVAAAPGGSETFDAMDPLPLAAPHEPPPEAAQVQVADVTPAGRGSATGAERTALGPAFETTIVYVVDVPGTTLATPSVFVIDRSACGFSASTSVAELLPGFGSVTPAGAATVAVFTSVPVANAETLAVTV
jgi:hypothetical protein